MKRISFFSIFFISCLPLSMNAIIGTKLDVPEHTPHIIVHFKRPPKNEAEHKRWNEIIEKSLEQINKKLAQEGLITPLKKEQLLQSFWDIFKQWYYKLFYKKYSPEYPKKENRAFFVRTDRDFGSYTMHIPYGVSYEVFQKYLEEIYTQYGVEFHMDKDAPIQITQKPNIGFEGEHFTLEKLEQLKASQLVSKTKQEIALLSPKKEENKQKIDKLTQELNHILKMKEALSWHLSFPTTGILLKEPFYPPAYPYIPHFFSLWQLAPQKGQHIRVAVIDTGVAAYAIKDDPAYRKHKDLMISMKPGMHNFNIVSADGLDPIEQLIELIKPYIDSNQFNQEYLEDMLPEWIKAYLINNNVQPIKDYLQKNGKSDLIMPIGSLTKKGEEALNAITTGRYGINPHKSGIKKPFTIKKLIEPYEQDVILELLPMPKITNEKITFVAGHGTHTFGLIAGKAQKEPNDDPGIFGIAPNADAFMIKAFQDSGVSEKSTLIAALKKAIIHDADVVNLSLKIADNLDLTEHSAQLLERMIDLIPYAVAASGNNGDPHLPNYAGEVESYPARFASVAFDVGAFLYRNGKAIIAPFSQYEPGVGPLFVAPGFDILSSGLVPGQKEDSIYVFMAGTSMAAPIMTGFVALMLGEFKDKFTREQLLKVCYTSAFKLEDNEEWQKKVILGVLDMRTALFILHVLEAFKKSIENRNLTFNIENQFDYVLQAIRYILIDETQTYAKDYLDGVAFRTNYMAYFNKAQKNKNKFDKTKYFMPKNLQEAVDYIVNTLLLSLGEKILEKHASQEIIKKVSELFGQPSIDLFVDLPAAAKERLITKETEKYWANKAEEVKLAKGQAII
ncbi:MAG: S8 family serine peptidase [Candidatus Babeliales bacterium]